MNILLISPYFAPAVGGVETHLTDLVNYFSKRKHTVYVRTYKALGTQNRGETNENTKHIKIHRLWWPDFNLVFKLEDNLVLRVLYISLGLFFDCLFFLLNNHNKINTIQVHGFIAALWGVPLAKIFRKRVIVNTHVGFKFSDGLMDNVIKLVLQNADQILVLTNNAKEELVKIGIKEDKINIYHYWVDQNKFKKVVNANKKVGWSKNLSILFVGRLVEVKGVLNIFKIAKNFPNIDFKIIGSGPLSGEVEKKSKKQKNTEFIGKVENNKLPIYYSAADLLLVPSKLVKQTFEEGIPRVMIESLSCGTPVIITPSGGIPDVFNEKIGLMPKSDVKSLTSAIKSMTKNKAKLQKAKSNARPFALKHFSAKKNAKIIEESLQ